MTERKPWLSTLALVGFEANAAIEAGHGNSLSFDEIYRGIERGLCSKTSTRGCQESVTSACTQLAVNNQLLSMRYSI